MITLNEIEMGKWNEHVVATYPEEAVAIVVNNEVVLMTNTSATPQETFKVEPTEFWKYKDSIQAVLHSHCFDLNDRSRLDHRVPSKEDMIGQINMNCWWGITATEGEGTTPILWFGPDRNEPYEGREFIFNVNDCLELVRDYYRRELGINIRPQARNWNWFETENLFEEAIDREGFVEVKIDEIQVNDVVYFNILEDKTNHIGVYLGDNQVLHHLFGRLSGIDSFSKWNRQIKKVVRKA